MTRVEAIDLAIDEHDCKYAEEFVDKIYNDHEVQLKARDEKIKELGEIVQQYLIPSKNYDAIIKAKDEEIYMLKKAMQEFVNKCDTCKSLICGYGNDRCLLLKEKGTYDIWDNREKCHYHEPKDNA